MVTEEECEALHAELLTFTFADWRQYALIHAMIDAGAVTVLECTHQRCLIETRQFIKKATRGHRAALVIDHVKPRRHGGEHRLTNLRLVHNACNCQWKNEEIGTYLDPDSKRAKFEAKRARVLSELATGAVDYSSMSRAEKISYTHFAKNDLLRQTEGITP